MSAFRFKAPPKHAHPDGSRAEVVSMSISTQDRGRHFDFSGPGDLPYEVDLRLLANDAFVQKLVAWFRGEGINVPGAPPAPPQRQIGEGARQLPERTGDIVYDAEFDDADEID